MNWLKKKIEEHNARPINYNKEEWTVAEFIFCLLGYTILPLVTWIYFGVTKMMWDVGYICVPMSIFFGAYLIYHLLFE